MITDDIREIRAQIEQINVTLDRILAFVEPPCTCSAQLPLAVIGTEYDCPLHGRCKVGPRGPIVIATGQSPFAAWAPTAEANHP